MANMDQIRDVKKLNKLVQVQLGLALEDLKKQGVNPLVAETLRTKERQKWLYGQGRTKAQCKAAGVPESYARAGPIVTATLNSIHITGMAVDVVPQRSINGKMTAVWDAKDKETKEIIAAMEKYGFEAGANWTTFPDSPHYQVKGCADVATVYSQCNNNKFITKVIQKALNDKIKVGLVIDGIWGSKTTKAVNAYRVSLGHGMSGTVGITLIKKLLG